MKSVVSIAMVTCLMLAFAENSSPQEPATPAGSSPSFDDWLLERREFFRRSSPSSIWPLGKSWSEWCTQTKDDHWRYALPELTLGKMPFTRRISSGEVERRAAALEGRCADVVKSALEELDPELHLEYWSDDSDSLRHLLVRSAGPDGQFGGPQYFRVTPGKQSPTDDLVWADGHWIALPQPEWEK